MRTFNFFDEFWVPLDVFEFKYSYLLSNYGRLIRLSYLKKDGNYIYSKLIAPRIDRYICYDFSMLKGRRKRIFAHRLVALQFIDNPHNKPCVNHIDGNKLNNHFTNLEWCTFEENNRHAILNGLNNCNSKLPYKDREFIINNINNIGYVEIMNRYSISYKYLYNILSSYKKANKSFTFPKMKSAENSKTMKKVINEITGEITNTKEICEKLGFNRKYLRKMLSGEKRNKTPYRYL